MSTLGVHVELSDALLEAAVRKEMAAWFGDAQVCTVHACALARHQARSGQGWAGQGRAGSPLIGMSHGI